MEETKRDSSKSHMDAHASDLDVAMLLARRASGTRRASLMLLSERRDELYIVASSGVPPQIATRVRVCLGDDVAGMVAETGQPLLMNAWRSRKHRTRYHTSTARPGCPSSFYGAVARLLPSRNYGVIYAAVY